MSISILSVQVAANVTASERGGTEEIFWAICIISRKDVQCRNRGYSVVNGVIGNDTERRRVFNIEEEDDNVFNNSISESLNVLCGRIEWTSSWSIKGRGTLTELRHGAVPMTYLL